MKKIVKGAIFYADLDPVVGSEQNGLRPVLILQNDCGNLHSSTVIVAPITTKKHRKLPTHVGLKEFEIIRPNSIVLAEQVRTIDKSRLKGFVGLISNAELSEIERALRVALDLN